MLNSRAVPKTKGGVGEVWWAVKGSDSKAAPDVVHGGQRHVTPLHHPSLNETLIGAITKSHQAIVIIQTGRRNNKNIKSFTDFYQSKHILIYSRMFIPSLSNQ